MRRTSFVVVLAMAVFGRGSQAAPPLTPVIVELFTSEGCSDCPPADTLLQKLIDTQPVGGAEVIGLGKHVDYWDRQGWKDRFSSAALTNRQRTYSARFGNDSIYTPQMVVDGRAEFVGSDAAAARRAVEHARTVAHGSLSLELSGGGTDRGPEKAALHVSVTASDLPKSGRGDRADLILVVTEDQLRSEVKRGENRGKVLTHAAVVRYLATIGEAGAAPVRADIALSPEWQRDHLKVVAFVQEAQSRAILASAAVPLKNTRP